MPEDLLLDLPPLPTPGGTFLRLEVQVQSIERLVASFEEEVAEHVEHLRGSASSFENVWQRFIQAVIDGQAEKVQATRPKALEGLLLRLTLLNRLVRVITLLRQLSAGESLDLDMLRHEIVRLEGLKTKVFDRWQTVEDLEGLVAEATAPTEREFNAVLEKYGPPTVWYEQCGEPRPEPS